jgi:hypothetical protein
MSLNFVNKKLLLQFFFVPSLRLSYVSEVNEWVSNFFQNSNSDASQRPERLAVIDPDQALRARIG